jgi:plastocyanin
MKKNAPAFALFFLFSLTAASAQEQKMMKDDDVKIIELVQTKGEFEQKELALTPGKYRFKIVNKSVNHPVGFHISERMQDGKNGKDIVGFGTIPTGEAKTTDVVELKAGEYNYDCPLNPTPSYKLTVKEMTSEKMQSK